MNSHIELASDASHARKLNKTHLPQANTKPTNRASTPLTPGAHNTHGSTDDVFEDIQVRLPSHYPGRLSYDPI